MKRNTVQGFFLIDPGVVALNNAGINKASNTDNTVATKKVYSQNRPYPYVSGQALRSWIRTTLQQDLGWEMSPITRNEKTAFVAANPVIYADDDVFGYMKAAKEAILDGGGETVKDSKGKEKKEDVTVTRKSPLDTAVTVSAGPASLARNWSSMSRQVGDSIPFQKEEYYTVLKGMFAINLPWVGVFSSYNKSGFKNITEALAEKAVQEGATLVDDPYVLNDKGLPHKLVKLSDDIRYQRASDVLKAFKTLKGGAMQSDNMGDVTPKFIILATMTSGNHPFSHIISERAQTMVSNQAEEEDSETDVKVQTPVRTAFRVELSAEAIKEVLMEYSEYIVGDVYIGKRLGFMDELNEDLQALETLGAGYPKVHFGPVNKIIDAYCVQLKDQI